MIMFKLYFKILTKHKIAIFIYLVIFAFIMILLLSFTKPVQTEYSNYETRMAFIDHDQTEFTASLKEYLDDYAVFVSVAENKLDDAFFYRDVLFILIIPEGFTESFLSEKAINLQYRTLPDSPSSYMLQTQINKYLNLAYIYLHNDLEYENLNKTIKENLDLEISTIFSDAPQIDYSYINFYFNYAGYLIMIIFISVMGGIMLSFKPIGIKRRIDIGMITNRKMNLILILANIVFGLSLLVFIILCSIILYGNLIFTKQGLLFVLNSFFFAIPIIALAYLLSVIFNSINIISALGTVISLGSAFITGIFIPQFLIDEKILKLAQIFPSYWFVRTNNDLGFYHKTDTFIEGALAQITFTIIFIILSLIISKKKRQSEDEQKSS